MMRERQSNPFAVTKAVDLSAREIFDLWVDFSSAKALKQLARPASPMPTLILGGKGSGKTHWMRYYSLPLQKIRYEKENVKVVDGLLSDGYVGIYLLMGGMNAERFKGKGVDEEVWKELFAYYVELWLAQEVVSCINSVIKSDEALASDEGKFVSSCFCLFDSIEQPPDGGTVDNLLDYIGGLQKKLDYAINNAAFTRKIDIDIVATRGKLIFGIPEVVGKVFPVLAQILFVYQLDELENFDEPQQRLINTLVREHEPPVTFRIGARLYGIKTMETYSAGEENREGSEYELLPLDERLRENQARYEEFAQELIGRRLGIDAAIDVKALEGRLNDLFQTVDLGWNSNWYRDHLKLGPSGQRPYFQKLSQQLEQAKDKGAARGIKHPKDAAQVMHLLAMPDFPLLEKANLLAFYKAWNARKNLMDAASQIQAEAERFSVGGDHSGQYGQRLQHYKSDLIAQLAKETAKEIPLYAGLENFIFMADGLPRTLVVLLKNIWDWAIYRREGASRNSPISVEAQEQGVRQTSEWFLENMRKTGKDGVAIRTAVENIATIFKISRFSDKPIECSLIGFSVNEAELEEESARIIKLAERYSFLVRIPGGQKDKNKPGLVTSKFQLNRMLSPHWDLPLARRGTMSLTPEQVSAIFNPAKKGDFSAFARKIQKGCSAPFLEGGKRKSIDIDQQAELF